MLISLLPGTKLFMLAGCLAGGIIASTGYTIGKEAVLQFVDGGGFEAIIPSDAGVKIASVASANAQVAKMKLSEQWSNLKQFTVTTVDSGIIKVTFFGSSSCNMITYDPTTNVGFDFDVNITVNNDEENYSPKEIRTILHNAFSRFTNAYCFNKCEQSTRVISIKFVDPWRSRITHSCDFAIVREGRDGQQYIRFNKKRNYFSWEFQTQPYKELESRADYLKENGHWNEVLEVYRDKKNFNDNPDKHSRSLYAEAINECFRRYNNHK